MSVLKCECQALCMCWCVCVYLVSTHSASVCVKLTALLCKGSPACRLLGHVGSELWSFVRHQSCEESSEWRPSCPFAAKSCASHKAAAPLKRESNNQFCRVSQREALKGLFCSASRTAVGLEGAVAFDVVAEYSPLLCPARARCPKVKFTVSMKSPLIF